MIFKKKTRDLQVISGHTIDGDYYTKHDYTNSIYRNSMDTPEDLIGINKKTGLYKSFGYFQLFDDYMKKEYEVLTFGKAIERLNNKIEENTNYNISYIRENIMITDLNNLSLLEHIKHSIIATEIRDNTICLTLDNKNEVFISKDSIITNIKSIISNLKLTNIRDFLEEIGVNSDISLLMKICTYIFNKEQKNDTL
jgi:hypothetical protein